VLKALAALRGKRDVRFGLWCEVIAPGRVRVGDTVSLA
jgi:MOSC domain-containing protein YiiM